MIGANGAGVTAAKALSTPDDFSVGLFDSIGRAAGQIGVSLDELIERTEQVVVGTTVGTNAFVERKGAMTGMLVTKGFRDTLFIMRGVGRVTGRPPEEQLLLETSQKPEPIVPKPLVREVDERVDWAGEVLRGPDRPQILAAVDERRGRRPVRRRLLPVGVQGAVQRGGRARRIREAHPGLYVSCSHEIAPKMGEYDVHRGAVNAYVGPVTARYLEHVGGALRGRGYDDRLLVMGCDGGVRSARAAAAEAIVTLNSGRRRRHRVGVARAAASA